MDIYEPGTAVVLYVRLDGIAYISGRVVRATPTHVVLEAVTWHRQTGRNADFLAGTSPSTEREAYPPTQEWAFRRADIPASCLGWKGDLALGTL